MKFQVTFFLVCLAYQEISGHGMLLQPPNRSSRWRYDKTAPPNTDDNANNCGGFWTQYGENDGKCGVCGDNYVAPHPQDNENTGFYGNGVVVATYESGSVIQTEVNITSNHLGYFHFDICVLEDPTKPESGEECFKPLELANGDLKVDVIAEEHYFLNEVRLPNMTCDRCVLRWTYKEVMIGEFVKMAIKQ